MKWAYGVTTVLARRHDLLPRTLASLRAAGLDQPRLFVDGCTHLEADRLERETKLPVTARYPFVRTACSWILAMYELYLRDRGADRFAMFQDDVIVCKDLRR